MDRIKCDLYGICCLAVLASFSHCVYAQHFWGNSSTNSSTQSSALTNVSIHSLTQGPVSAAPTSTCVGNCQTSVPGCDVRGPTTQTGIVTIIDVGGKLVPVPCPVYISLWNGVQASKNNRTGANATSTTSSNAWPSTAYPPFLFDLESSMIGSCDIFGAICQTGTIEAKLNLTSAVSTTTVACSDYLEAQQAAVIETRGGPYIDRDKYAVDFGRSPQCSAFVKRIARSGALDAATRSYYVDPSETLLNSAWYSSVKLEDYSLAGYTLSAGTQIPPEPTPLAGCPSNASEFDTNLYPGGTHQHIGAGRDWDCCGWCNLHVPELKIFYFPDELEVVGSGHSTTNATRTRPVFDASAAGKRGDPLPNKLPVTAVVSGYTYTSGSVYISIKGPASVTDFCGPVGPVFTNPIIPIKGQISTGSYSYTLGQLWQGDLGVPGTTKALNYADLVNPTWGLSDEFETVEHDSHNANPSYTRRVRTIGPPFYPVVIPPSELLTLASEWTVCPGFGGSDGKRWGNGFGAPFSYGIFDPPHALVPGDNLDPAVNGANGPPQADPTPPSSPDPPHQQNAPQAGAVGSPGQPPITRSAPSVPQATALEGQPQHAPHDPKQPPSQNPPQGDPHPPGSGNSPDPGNSPSSGNLPGSGRPSDPGNSHASGNSPSSGHPSHPGNPPGSENPPSSGTSPQPVSIDLSNPNGAPPETVSSAPADKHPNFPDLGGIIFSAFGGGVPEQSSSKTTIPLPPPGPTTAIISPAVGPPLTVLNPSVVAVGSNVILANGDPATVDGQVKSLDPTAGIIVESVRGAAAPTAAAGNAVPADPGKVVVAGYTLAPGDPAITVGGTPVSLARSGTLVVGTSSIALSPPQTPSAPQHLEFSVAGVTFAAAPSAAAITLAGTTITPGGPAVVLSGTPVSLAHSGVLVIGTSHIPLTAPASQPQASIYSVGGQTFTANPTAIPIAGTTLKPGGPAVTISGTLVSLGASGTLVIGSSSMSIPTAQGSSIASVYTVADQTFTANPTALLIAGTTLRPGGPAVTISGTVISLEASGTLVIGSSTISIPTVGSSSVASVFTVGTQISTATNSSAISGAGTTLVAGVSSVGVSASTGAVGRPSSGVSKGRKGPVPLWLMMGVLVCGSWAFCL